MPDPTIGRRASDQVAARNATDIAVMESRLKVQEDESARNRSFRHETANTLQKLVGNMENMSDDIKSLLGLSGRVTSSEQEQASHTAICGERYKSIADYMIDSKKDRDAIRSMIFKSSISILVVLVGIVGYFLARFGLPPMGP